jgi:hypothetical protein
MFGGNGPAAPDELRIHRHRPATRQPDQPCINLGLLGGGAPLRRTALTNSAMTWAEIAKSASVSISIAFRHFAVSVIWPIAA